MMIGARTAAWAAEGGGMDSDVSIIFHTITADEVSSISVVPHFYDFIKSLIPFDVLTFASLMESTPKYDSIVEISGYYLGSNYYCVRHRNGVYSRVPNLGSYDAKVYEGDVFKVIAIKRRYEV